MSIPRFPPSLVLALTLSAFATPPSIAQDPCLEWTVDNILPSVSGCNCPHEAQPGIWPLAYDCSRGVTVMYRPAYNIGNPIERTWLFGGKRWSQCISSTAIGNLDGAAMAYDTTNRGVIIYGGATNVGGGSLQTATWLWDGSDWNQIATSGPPGRTRCAMASDDARSRIVLFGGSDAQSNVLGDTWEWDGGTWTQRLPISSPPARTAHAMCYDSSRQIVVLFGGASSIDLNDTWEWDGENWHPQIPETSPPASSSPTMAFDSARSLTVMVRGSADNQPGEMWVYDGKNWTQQTSSAPGPSGSMTYDNRRGKLVLFRTNYTGAQTWAYPNSVRPFFVKGPVSYSACLGDSAMFSVIASGDSPMSYQWNRGGVALNLPGATTPTLTIPIADFGSAGDYTVVVTNSCGSAESAAASLTVCAGVSGCPSPVDVNGDGLIDGADIQRIVEVLLAM